MNILHWRLRRISRHMGAAGVAGLACLVTAFLLAATQTLPIRAENAKQTRLLAELRARVAAKAVPPSPVDPVPQPLTDLPPTGTAAEQIGTLEHLARAHGIALPRGQYSATRQPGGAFTRWQIVLPVETTYPALHAWLATLLERLPNLALDEIKLKRERIESATLQAELHLVLYVESLP